MFLTVTPNLCVERTIEIPDFALEHVHRVPPERVHQNAGGKGINAARVAAALGSEVTALSWVGKQQKGWFEAQLVREGIPHDLIEVPGDTRICTNILHGEARKTEIVEAGNPVGPIGQSLMFERFNSLLARSELAAVCGSYPPPPADSSMTTHFAMMCGIAKKSGKKLLVDSKGAAFEELLREKNSPEFLPWAIKPNCDEAASLLEHPITNEAEEVRAIRELLALGVEVVLLSCGARGAYLGTSEGTHFFAPPAVHEISAVGSGDSFVGAFAAMYLQTGNLIEATRWAAAAGAASASQKLSAFCTREEIEALLPQVIVTKL